MSAIRGGRAAPGFGSDHRCAYCGETIRNGAEWRGFGLDVAVCRGCTEDGQLLGALLGDTATDPGDLQRLLRATERQAWRALALAQNSRAQQAPTANTRGEFALLDFEEDEE